MLFIMGGMDAGTIGMVTFSMYCVDVHGVVVETDGQCIGGWFAA